ncbi:MAG: SGNH/GDSL hydrolase family protein [Mobilitalea sp.]
MKKAKLLIFMLASMLLCFACAKQNGDDEKIGKEVNTETSSVETAEATIVPTEAAGETTDAEESTEAEESTDTEEGTGDTTEVELANAVTGVKLPVANTDYVTEDIYKNAVLAEGNLSRLASAMNKAKKGEEITIGVIGGSITQGSLATNSNNSYASRFYQWWVQAFPNAKINFVNAGIGATTSYLAVHRVDQHLLVKKPDVVIVEFSVNDSDSVFFKETYEDLVRRILKAENNPAVILLFMTMEDGTSAQPSHMHIGFWYDLPRISYREAIRKEIEKGNFTWKDISPDNIHPNDKGHAIVGEILWDYLNSVAAKLSTITEEVAPLEKEPFFEEAYIDATILDSANIEPSVLGSFAKSSVYDRFKNNWTTTSGNDAIVFETEAQNIGIMFYKTTDGKSGQFDILIDGVFNRTLDADFTGGWGNYAESIEVYRSDDKKMHKIEIKKSANSTGDVFSVLGLLIS